MNRLFDYFTNHPFLAGGAVLALLTVAAFEWRQRAHAFAAVAPAEAVRMMNQGAVLVDVRSANQYKDGHIEGARNVPGDQFAGGPGPLEKLKDKPLLLCCDSGQTSAAAARTLVRGGFQNVYNLRGGLAAWRQDNLPLVRG